MLKDLNCNNLYKVCLLNLMSQTMMMLLIVIFWHKKCSLPVREKWYFNIL